MLLFVATFFSVEEKNQLMCYYFNYPLYKSFIDFSIMRKTAEKMELKWVKMKRNPKKKRKPAFYSFEFHKRKPAQSNENCRFFFFRFFLSVYSSGT